MLFYDETLIWSSTQNGYAFKRENTRESLLIFCQKMLTQKYLVTFVYILIYTVLISR